MKGNHNSLHRLFVRVPIVFNKSKIQNERKSQRDKLFDIKPTIVFNKSKIQNERKSQPNCPPDCYSFDCVQQVKDTK